MPLSFWESIVGSSLTAEQVTKDANLTGKVAIVTGANTGIGKETARVLCMRGAHVILASRDMKKNQEALDEIRAQLPVGTAEQRGGSLVPIEPGVLSASSLDLANLQSVKDFAQQFLEKGLKLHLLICNAGLMAPETRLLTSDGYEMQWGVNHLGHFLLVHLLIDKMIESVEEGFKPRVIMLSSVAHKYGHIDFNDPNWERRVYKPLAAYGQSKLANLLFARELNKRFGDQGLLAVSVHPGVVTTELSRNNGKLKFFYAVTLPFLKNVPQGASTTCFCASAPDDSLAGGGYYADSELTKPVIKEATDDAVSARLYDYSAEILGIPAARL